MGTYHGRRDEWLDAYVISCIRVTIMGCVHVDRSLEAEEHFGVY